MNTERTARPFAVFDIDGTLVRWQLYHATTDALAKSGYLDEKSYDDIRRARKAWKSRASTDAFKKYEAAVIRGFEQIITKASVEEFMSAVNSVIEEYKDQVYTFSRQLIQKLKSDNYLLFAISGSQAELVQQIAAYYGFDDYTGTDYIKLNGKFTGEKNFYAHDKKAALEKLIKKHNPAYAGSLAIGDSASDIPMLQMVEQPIAFNPEQTLYEAAKAAGWTIVIERKNIFYKLELKNGSYLLA